MSTVVLQNISTVVEWQCAHDAVKHVEPDQKITLTYDTPDGDLTLSVSVLEGAVVVMKENTSD